MAILVNAFFEKRLEQLYDLASRLDAALVAAGIEYRVIGGLATYLYVEQASPDAGRLTKDIDITVRREDLPSIQKAVEPFGLSYRHVAGIDMLVQVDQPSTRRAIHMVFTGEKVRPEYSEPAPPLGASRVLDGLRVIDLPDLVRMKLTSFRLKDQTHIKDMDEAGIITPDIEQLLPIELRARLTQVRATD